MTRLSEQPAKKLAPLLHAGEQLLAAIQFQHETSESGRNPRLAAYAETFGFDPMQDLSYQERAVYGYAGVTSRRLLVAKSPVFWKVKPKHLFLEAPITECSLRWYDSEGMGTRSRVMLFEGPGRRFATAVILLKWIGQFGKGQEEALRALADGIVEAFGPRATMTPPAG